MKLRKTSAAIGLLVVAAVLLLTGGRAWIAELTDTNAPPDPSHGELMSGDTQPGLAGNAQPPKPAALGRVEGRVLASGSGEVIANVRLRLVGRDAAGEAFSQTARTDGAGSFAFDAVPVGDDHLLHVVAASETRSVPSVAVVRDETTSIGTIWLARGAVLDGIVRDETRVPIVGAKLRVFGQGTDETTPLYEAESDEHGRFALSDVAPGFYSIEVRATGKVSEQLGAKIANGQLVQGPLDIVLQDGVRVAGRVVDVRGKGIGDARIECAFVDGNASTDEDGHFTLFAPPERAYLFSYMSVSAAGYPGLFTVDWTADEDKTIVLLRGARLTLHVTDAGSRPLPEAVVSVELTVPGGNCHLDGITSAEGVLALDAPEATVSWIAVEHPDHRRLVWSRGDDGAEGPVQGLTAGRILPVGPNTCRIRLPSGAPGSVMGRITDESGDPIEGAAIVLTEPWTGASYAARSGADGAYALDVHSRKGGDVTITAPGFLSQSHNLDWGEVGASDVSRIDAHLLRGVTVIGRVVDEAGEPVAGASVCVADQSGWTFDSGGWTWEAATTSADGAFVLRGIAPFLSLGLLVSRRGFVDRSLDLGEHLEGVLRSPDIRMQRGVRLGVTVWAPDGRPAAGARVRRHRSGDNPWGIPFGGASHEVVTRATGHADLEHVPAGGSTLYITCPGTAGVMRQLDLDETTADERVVLTLRPGFTARTRRRRPRNAGGRCRPERVFRGRPDRAARRSQLGRRVGRRS